MYAPAVVLGQWWRLFTAMFLHFGLAHIASNMLSLYLLGRPCETVLGHVRMLILYLVSGVAGNVLTLIADLYENGFDPRSMTVTTDNFAVSAGASGAIFGLGRLSKNSAVSSICAISPPCSSSISFTVSQTGP